MSSYLMSFKGQNYKINGEKFGKINLQQNDT